MPRFEPERWGGGGYLMVDSVVGHLIDWYNVQIYNRKSVASFVANLLILAPQRDSLSTSLALTF